MDQVEESSRAVPVKGIRRIKIRPPSAASLTVSSASHSSPAIGHGPEDSIPGLGVSNGASSVAGGPGSGSGSGLKIKLKLPPKNGASTSASGEMKLSGVAVGGSGGGGGGEGGGERKKTKIKLTHKKRKFEEDQVESVNAEGVVTSESVNERREAEISSPVKKRKAFSEDVEMKGGHVSNDAQANQEVGASVAETVVGKWERVAHGQEKDRTRVRDEMLADERSGWMEGVGTAMNSKYRSILKQLKEAKSEDGRVLATSLLTLPDPASNPSYYVQISDPIALDTIESNVGTGSYATAKDFDTDLARMFKNARLASKGQSELYGDILTLQRTYHELTAIPNSGKKKEFTMADTTPLKSVNWKGEELKAGDWVHMHNHRNPEKPTIAQIFNTYKRIDGQRCLSICWYFRPEETVHHLTRSFYENEVFKTSHVMETIVDEFIERCFVMFVSYYVRGRPKKPLWEPGMEVYVCESRYIDKSKTFQKIKNWGQYMPEESRKSQTEYEMDLFPSPAKLKKYKSPFSPGGAVPLGSVVYAGEDAGPPPASTVNSTTIELPASSVLVTTNVVQHPPSTPITQSIPSQKGSKLKLPTRTMSTLGFESTAPISTPQTVSTTTPVLPTPKVSNSLLVQPSTPAYQRPASIITQTPQSRPTQPTQPAQSQTPHSQRHQHPPVPRNVVLSNAIWWRPPSARVRDLKGQKKGSVGQVAADSLKASGVEWEEIPTEIAEKVRKDEKGRILWFPTIEVDTQLKNKLKPVGHSLEYLVWLAKREERMTDSRGDAMMVD